MMGLHVLAVLGKGDQSLMDRQKEHQKSQVKAAFSIAQTAVLALHLARLGEIVQETFEMISHRHKLAAQAILKTRPFLAAWMDPGKDVLEEIGKLLKQNRHLFLEHDDELAHAAKDINNNNLDLEAQVKRHQEEAADAKRHASLAYATFIERAIDVMLQKLYTHARQT